MADKLSESDKNYIMAAFGRFTERNHLPSSSKCYIALRSEIYLVDGLKHTITRCTEDLERSVRELKKM